MDLEQIISIFGAKKCGANEWKAHCPCPTHGAGHGDRNESLYISKGNLDNILIYCQAGCDKHDILDAVGLKMSDLFADVDKPKDEPYQRAIDWLIRHDANIEKLVTVYDYSYGRYQDGLQKLRFKTKDGGKTFRWIMPNSKDSKGAKWLLNRSGAEPRLYVAGNIDDSTVYVVEGEKDADTLHDITGYTAVSAENGAQKTGEGSKWKQEYSDQLTGKKVYVLWDHDEVGEDFADITAAKLLNYAAAVYKLDLSSVWHEIPEKGDITDMVESLGEAETLSLLQRLIDNAEPEQSPDIADEYAALDIESVKDPTSVRKIFNPAISADFYDRFLSAVQSTTFQPIKTGFKALDEALCKGDGGILPKSLVILTAAPATGKTTFCQQILDTAAENGNDVIFLNLEMSREQLYAKSLSRWLHQHKGIHYTMTDILQGYKWDAIQRDAIFQAAEEYRRAVLPHMMYNPEGMGSDITMLDGILQTALKQAKIEKKPRAPIVCLDYLHLIHANDMDAAATIKLTVDKLKKYAITGNTIAIAISAANRVSNKSTLDMFSGRDTSAIEYHADYQLGLENDVEASRNSTYTHIKLKIFKNRLDKINSNGIPLGFVSDYNYFFPDDLSR